MICDAQVHAPDAPHRTRVGGLAADILLAEMDELGVERCVVVPPAAPGDVSANNAAALQMAREHPDRFAVMGRFEHRAPDPRAALAEWCAPAGMLGIRTSLIDDAYASMFRRGQLDGFWAAAADFDVPVSVLVMHDYLPMIGMVAARFPSLRIIVDHLGLTPHVVYPDPRQAIAVLLPLSKHPNLAVKASALPAYVDETFPFPSLHAGIRDAVAAFGSSRVFWGSDLSHVRTKASYAQTLDLFRIALEPLPPADRDDVLGDALLAWLRWPTQTADPAQPDASEEPHQDAAERKEIRK